MYYIYYLSPLLECNLHEDKGCILLIVGIQ